MRFVGKESAIGMLIAFGMHKQNGENKMTRKIETAKAADLFSREYGKDAYQAWRRREAEISELARRGRYSRREIIRMREDSFRQMKAEGARWAAAKAAVKPVRGVLARIAA